MRLFLYISMLLFVVPTFGFVYLKPKNWLPFSVSLSFDFKQKENTLQLSLKKMLCVLPFGMALFELNCNFISFWFSAQVFSCCETKLCSTELCSFKNIEMNFDESNNNRKRTVRIWVHKMTTQPKNIWKSLDCLRFKLVNFRFSK